MDTAAYIAYAAHTTSCTFLLDADGICRRIVLTGKAKRKDAWKTASLCVGAQYVASLDPEAAGCLVEMPRVGSPMLFARVDERGRISLVRTGPVTAFEEKSPDITDENPFVEELSVMTSAPEVTPRVDPDLDYLDASERTQPLQALRMPPSVAKELGRTPDESQELPTRDYELRRSAGDASGANGRATPPNGRPSVAPTLRTPPHDTLAEDSNPYLRRQESSRSTARAASSRRRDV